MIKQKIIALVLTIVALAVGRSSAWAQEPTSGTYGYPNLEDVSWAVTDEDDNGTYETITISGTGAMRDCGSVQPWAAFKSTLTTVVIEDGVTRIGADVFYQFTALTSVSIASSVTTIDDYAFGECTNLGTIDGASGLTYLGYNAFIRTAWENNLPDGLTYLGHVAYQFKGDGTSVTLDENTTQIYIGCFYRSKITSIVIPASVTNIETYAFEESALKMVYCLGTEPELGNYVFDSCSQLTDIIVPAEAVSNYYSNFDSYSSILKKGYTVTCDEGITATTFAPIVAEGEKVTLNYTGTIPEGNALVYIVKDAGNNAFEVTENNGVYSFNMPDKNVTVSVTFVQTSGTCGKTENDNVTWAVTDEDNNGTYETITISGTGKMADYSLDDQPWVALRSNITTAVIGEGVTSIGENAFYNCINLTSATFAVGSLLESIGRCAFYYCKSLTEITIPEEVTFVGAYAFASCDNLKKCTLLGSKVIFEDNVFESFGGEPFFYASLEALSSYYDRFQKMHVSKSKIVGMLTAKEGEPGEYWTSFCSVYSHEVPSDAKIYKAAISGTKLVLTELTNDKVVNCGQTVIMKTTSPAILLPVSTSDGQNDFSGNQLTATYNETSNPGNAYVLDIREGTDVGLYRLGENEKVGACEAYLQYSGSPACEVFPIPFSFTNLQAKLTASSTDADAPTVITLDRDVVAESGEDRLIVPFGRHAIIDLNGHDINRHLSVATGDGHVINVRNNATLVIRDSQGGGQITGGYTSATGGGITVSGTLTLEGGTICGNRSQNNGGGLSVSGTFIMIGGTITDNTCTGNYGEGSAIYTNGGTINLQGGTITGNKGNKDRSAIYVTGGTGHLNVKGSYDVSSNITNTDDPSDATYVTDIVLEGRVINIAGAISPVHPATVAFANGGPTLTSGWSTYMSAADPDDCFTITASDKGLGMVNGEVTIGTLHTITLADANITASATSAAQGKRITLAYTGVVPDGYIIIYSVNGNAFSGNTLTMPDEDVTVSADIYALGEIESNPFVVTTWADLKEKMAEGGYIRLDADVTDPDKTSDSRLIVPGGKTVTLDLNGHTIDRGLTEVINGGEVIYISGNLTLNDSGTGGTITGGYGKYCGGGVNLGNGTFTMNGGTITSNNTTSSGGGVYVCYSATFTMNGGTISGNTCGTNGGGVYLFNDNSTFTMNGGTISGNTCGTNGGGVYMYYDSCIFNISGNSVITGNTNAAGKEENVCLQGVQLINIDAPLTAGASIGVTDGLPSTGDAPVVIATGATDGDSQYFHSDITCYTIEEGQGEQAGMLLLTPPASTPWSELKAQLEAGGTVTLTDDVTALECDGGYAEITNTVTLDLNGHNITVNENFDHVIFICENGNLTLTGSGTISGSKEYAVNVNYSSSTFTMTGGTISGGTGGGVYVKNGTFCVSGSPIITGNTKNGIACNVYLLEEKTINVVGALSADARIGVIMKDNSGVFTSGLSGNGTVANFTSDNSACCVCLNGSGEAALGVVYVDENNAESMVTEFTVIESNITEFNAGWYALTDDVIINDRITCNGNVRLILCDGATLTAPEGIAVNDNDRLTIYGQTTGAGTLEITGSGSDSNAGLGGDESCAGGVITINGGIINVNIDNSSAVGAAIGGGENGEGFVYINGGTVSASTSSGLGAGIGGSNRHSGYVMIKGGHVTASSIGGGDRGGGSTLLSWTNLSDTIKADSYVGSVTLDKDFRADDTFIRAGSVLDKSTIAGKTLTSSLLELRDNADNTSIINDNNSKTYNVTLIGRTLYKDGDWNTLCLPFDLTISGSVLDGDNVDVRTLSSTEFSNGTLTLNFTPATGEGAVTSICAGVPYIIKWDNTGSNLVNPTFSGVTISSGATANVETTYADFIGTYNPIVWETEDKSILFVGTNNQLYWPTVGGHINACRAYFQLNKGLTAGDVQQARMNVDDDDVTGIQTTDYANYTDSDAWYDMSGRKLDGKPTQAGLYIHNGNKVVIK